jgi:soluble lytic murein transglycosylase
MFRESVRSLVFFTIGITLTSTFMSVTVGCAAWNDSEEAALRNLREMSRNGNLPPESVVADVERRFINTRTGTLAKLLRARIRIASGDFAGAHSILAAPAVGQMRGLADYVHWLRGRALQGMGNHSAALQEFSRLIKEHPDSLRVADAKVLWAESAVETGLAGEVPSFLDEFVRAGNPVAMVAVAKAYQRLGDRRAAVELFRKVYFFNAGGSESRQAEAVLNELAQPLTPVNAEEIRARAEGLLASSDFPGAAAAYATLVSSYPSAVDNQVNLDRMKALIGAGRITDARPVFDTIPRSALQKEPAYAALATGYVRARSWQQARTLLAEFLQTHPGSPLLPKAFVDAGMAAREAKNRVEETYFLREAVARFPEAVEVAAAQFELAWLEHESGNHERASRMLIEHLARYSARDSSFRGRAGYWAARNAQRAGRTAEACALYEALVHRYSSNWYGYLGLDRLGEMRKASACQEKKDFSADRLMGGAIENLKTVTVAPERASEGDRRRLEKAADLGFIGLFDWASSELQTAQRAAGPSPSVSMALARHHRLRGDNVSALLALAKAYPDYAQMFPEEMGREEWDIFYPLTNWKEISHWSKQRGLDPFKVAGLIRQESVFNPRARSSANAYGLMQLLLPTARLVARKYNPPLAGLSIDNLYDPATNIELGTAYMKDQLANYGRVEYMAAAYNAGPGRVVTWRKTLPSEMDEFVEAIPFRETRMYVQGVIRNTAQYRKIYDENGNFRPNVGTRAGGRQRIVNN